MNKICFSLMLMASITLFAAGLPSSPSIFNNTSKPINFSVDGGKTPKACSFIGLDSGEIAPNQSKTVKLKKTKDADEIKFLCMIIESEQLLKVANNPRCLININQDNKVSINNDCKEGLKNES